MGYYGHTRCQKPRSAKASPGVLKQIATPHVWTFSDILMEGDIKALRGVDHAMNWRQSADHRDTKQIEG